MSKQLQLRRGTTIQNEAFTGAVGELTLDTDTGEIRVHDGVTQGGAEFIDAVVEFQKPTAENNYTWYRKYASGWVEQGGVGTGSGLSIVLPVTMLDTNYTLAIASDTPTSTTASTVHGCHYDSKTTTGFRIICLAGNSGSWVSQNVSWQVSGMAA